MVNYCRPLGPIRKLTGLFQLLRIHNDLQSAIHTSEALFHEYKVGEMGYAVVRIITATSNKSFKRL